jgi:hypothetical protein
MPANTNPIYALTPNIGMSPGITAALNATGGLTTGTVGTNVFLIFTAGANGSWVKQAICKPGTGANTAATVMRLWKNNGGAIGTRSTSVLMKEMGIPATTTSATLPQPDFVLPLNLRLKSGDLLYVTFGTAPGGSGDFDVSCEGADY